MPSDPGQQPPYSPNDIIVIFKPGVTPQSLLPGTQVHIMFSSPGMGALTDVTLSPGVTVQQALRAYSASPKVASAEPDWIAYAMGEPVGPSRTATPRAENAAIG
jgi:hypothetical protein